MVASVSGSWCRSSSGSAIAAWPGWDRCGAGWPSACAAALVLLLTLALAECASATRTRTSRSCSWWTARSACPRSSEPDPRCLPEAHRPALGADQDASSTSRWKRGPRITRRTRPASSSSAGGRGWSCRPATPRASTSPKSPAPIDSNYTDIAAAIKLALASFPEGTGKRIVLISDGNENLGNAEEQARIAKLNGVQIDVVPLAAGYRNENEVLVKAWRRRR